MTNINARTVRPRPTGNIRGTWREKFGNQHVTATVDSGRSDQDSEFRVVLDRRWGPQIGDTRTQDFMLSREGAETLRDALTAALEWSADSEGA